MRGCQIVIKGETDVLLLYLTFMHEWGDTWSPPWEPSNYSCGPWQHVARKRLRGAHIGGRLENNVALPHQLMGTQTHKYASLNSTCIKGFQTWVLHVPIPILHLGVTLFVIHLETNIEAGYGRATIVEVSLLICSQLNRKNLGSRAKQRPNGDMWCHVRVR